MKESHLSFEGLGIAPKLIETLTRLKFVHATPIQHKTIPIALQGHDLIGIAQTGTGKTLAFSIPTLQRLAQNKSKALVLVPTRELAYQVEETVKKISHVFGVRTVTLVGGASIFNQVRDLQRNPRVIIATPGRLQDLLNQKKIRLHDVNTLILDEADRMLDMGFAPQIDAIIRILPHARQTMLFSATMPPTIVKMAASYMKTPLSVEIAPAGTAAESVTHEMFIVRKDMKRDLLKKILAEYRGSVLVFTRTKMGAMKLAKAVRDFGLTSAEIHSNRSLSQRREALEGFRIGKYRVLVATDIAARGIDVKGIELVVNYDMPENAESYVHRIGRTGRAKAQGHAISFADPTQRGNIADIQRLIKVTIPVKKHS